MDQRLELFQEMLAYVADNGPTESALISWHLEETPAETEDGVGHRLSFLKSIDILTTTDEDEVTRYELTPTAQRYLTEEDPRLIFDTLRKNVVGFEKIIEALGDRDMTNQGIADLLGDISEFDSGKGVAGRHIGWLEMLGYVRRDGATATLTEAGEALFTDIVEAAILSEDVEVWYMNPDDEWDIAVEHNATFLGWTEIEHIDFENSPEEEKAEALDALGENHPDTPGTVERFIEELPVGALLVAKTRVNRVYGLGVVTGEYYRKDVADLPKANVHFRDVEWVIDLDAKHGSPFELDWSATDNFGTNPFARGTIFEYSQDEYREIRRQVLDTYPELSEQFERLEYLAEGLTRRYQNPEAVNYYWVNQGSQAELDGEYLQAPSPHNSWQQMLSRTSPGDVVIHHWKGENEVIGHSTIIGEPEVVGLEDGKHQRVPVHFERFETPQPVDPVRQYLDNPTFIENTDYYIYTSNHRLQTGYLFDLPTEAGRRIIDQQANFEVETYAHYLEDLSVPPSQHTVEKRNLHFAEKEWDRIQDRVLQALGNDNHVLLFGPPGTGKTKLAQQICEVTVGADGYELVTASADWSTFDTVGGYQTTADNELQFEPGVILDRFHADEQGTPANEWLIIDELNRADIDKAFGSLFSALTGESVTLPFDSGGEPVEILDADRADEEVTSHRFYIPDDWRMIATMNTLDKTSLYEMSYAFMRRWAFIPVGIPDLSERDDLDDLVGAYVSGWATADVDLPETPAHYEPIGQIWRAVNEHRAIGPAIVEDIYRYVADASSPGDADYVSPIIMYVYPQLEGLRRTDLESVIENMESVLQETGENTDELWTVARDFFQIQELEKPAERG